MGNRKHNAETKAQAPRRAAEELGIDRLGAEDEAADLLLDRAAVHLREWNIPVPKGWLGGATAA
jgi:hypothetical protein